MPSFPRLTAAVLCALALVAATPAGATEPAAGERAAAPALTFVTYNVCKATCDAPAPPWSVRRDRLVNVVRALGKASSTDRQPLSRPATRISCKVQACGQSKSFQE